MPKLTIDNQPVEVDDGATILDAARKLGIEIPTMCHMEGLTPSTSCLICVVRVNGSEKLVPSCGAPAQEGMVVETATDDVLAARKAALELLLSDHLGDCMGPCHVTCPATMDIPLMLRQIASGQMREAIRTVKADIALPAVLGRICPAPCEKACRRAVHDGPVPICLLKRYVADVDLASDEPYLSQCENPIGKRVAIIGAGPAGLAAAYYLLQMGVECTIIDENAEAGGKLRYAVPDNELPRDVLDDEIAIIEKLGAKFVFDTRIADRSALENVRKDYDAVFIAIGKIEQEQAESLGFTAGRNGVKFDRKTYETALDGVFAGGDVVRSRKICVRSVADGKEAATSIMQYVTEQPVTGPEQPFNCKIGRLKEGEIDAFVQLASKEGPAYGPVEKEGLNDQQAVEQSLRCLHCDCRKADNCRLRDYSKQYQAAYGKYKAERRVFTQNIQHEHVIYERGKCIDCGLCIQIASQAGESLGLAFVGRGFDVEVAVPFDKSMAEALQQTAEQCIQACPTGALAARDQCGQDMPDSVSD